MTYWKDDDDDKKYQIDDEKLETIFDEPKKEIDSEKIAKEKKEKIITPQLLQESVDGLSPIAIAKEMRQSFLEYAMSVIVSRALPDARDGLKPVHRRIIYGMHELGINASAAYKKSARIVGDVLGKYHPHGDVALYEAMVRMAQDFSMRYLLVDGHGNFGSIDGDPAAAMRYTEVRMSKLAMLMIDSIKKDTVDFIPNYDASETEPIVLPVRFPQLLINGATGIAVGMATSIPPHNLNQTIDALIALANNQEIDILDLIKIIKAPDFPTGGLILGVQNIYKAYQTGRGHGTLRAKTQIEQLQNGKNRIIVNEIPYMVNKAKLVEKIAQLVKDKQIDGITDLRDESSRHGLRIVIELRRDVVPEVLRNQLFKLTSLQTNFSINLLALVNGEPKTMNLKEILNVFLKHQKEITRRRCQFELNKAQSRAHILDGLKKAIENIDQTIELIKKSNSEQDAQNNLIKIFKLSQEQSKAIIEMRFGRLTNLAIEKMQDELVQLKIQIENLNHILNDPQKLTNLIVNEWEEIKTKFGDDCRSQIVEGEIAIEDEDLIPQKDIAITVSSKGYVKRVPLEQFQIQKRGGIGSKSMTTYDDDDVNTIITTTTHTDLLIFTSFGKVYRIRAHQLPEMSKQAKGVPFVNIISQIDKNEKIVSLLTTNQYLPNQYLLTTTQNGIVKRTPIEQYALINKNGKKALILKENDMLVRALIVTEGEEVILGGSNGKIVRFELSQVRVMGRSAAGVKGINLENSLNEKLIGVSTSNVGQLILSIGKNGFGKLTPIEQYRKTKRGAKGVQGIDIKKAGSLRFVRVVKGDEDILITTKQGVTIRTNLEQVSRSSRNTKGVKIISLTKNNTIKSISIIDTKEIEHQIEEAIRKTQEIKIQLETLKAV